MRQILRVSRTLATPIVVIVGFVLFSDQIASLITRVTSFEFKAFKVTFGQGVAKAQELRSGQVTSKHCAGPREDRERERLNKLFELADNNGKGAVMDSFREIELAAIGAALKRSLPVTGSLGRVSGIAAIKSLEVTGQLRKPVAERYEQLRELRKLANDVKYPVDSQQAKMYTCEALTLAEELRSL